MEYLKIEGGVPLKGEVQVAGAKNSITKLLVASLLSDKPCTFKNVPDIGDVEVTVALLKEIGSEIEWNRQEGSLHIVTKEIINAYIPQRFSGSNRIPILMIGALLGRTTDNIIIPTVGGCNIGKRPVDFHIAALESMGAKIEYRPAKNEGAWLASGHSGLHGAIINLPYPSVGATENTILAAVRAEGDTEIRNAAMEPEVEDLILFLQKLGALISVEEDRTIRLRGTKTFYEVEHTVVCDRLEAASWALSAIATKGDVFVKGAYHPHMVTFLQKIREVGGGFRVKNDGIRFFYENPLKGGLHFETDVHPGFATDWQQPFVVLLTQADGTSVIHETVYEKRFGYTETLKQMGADIRLFKQCLGKRSCRFASKGFEHSLTVSGITPLFGQEIEIPDLRAGFAYVLAALIAEGTSTLKGLKFLHRGYASITEKLLSLGASVQKEPMESFKGAACIDTSKVKSKKEASALSAP